MCALRCAVLCACVVMQNCFSICLIWFMYTDLLRRHYCSSSSFNIQKHNESMRTLENENQATRPKKKPLLDRMEFWAIFCSIKISSIMWAKLSFRKVRGLFSRTIKFIWQSDLQSFIGSSKFVLKFEILELNEKHQTSWASLTKFTRFATLPRLQFLLSSAHSFVR